MKHLVRIRTRLAAATRSALPSLLQVAALTALVLAGWSVGRPLGLLALGLSLAVLSFAYADGGDR